MASLQNERIDEAAGSAFDTLITLGSEQYRRKQHLPRVLPIAGELLDAVSDTDRRALLARIARALRHERNRGRAGHWTYDLNRHIALAQAYAGELKLLSSHRRGS